MDSVSSRIRTLLLITILIPFVNNYSSNKGSVMVYKPQESKTCPEKLDWRHKHFIEDIQMSEHRVKDDFEVIFYSICELRPQEVQNKTMINVGTVQLFLNLRQKVSLEKAFRLQLCCWIDQIWWAELLHGWKFNDTLLSSKGQNWQSVNNLTLPGFELMVSKCPGGRVVLGEVVDRNKLNCSIEFGSILTLTQSEDYLPEFNQWYIMCYQINSMSQTRTLRRTDYFDWPMRNGRPKRLASSSDCIVCDLDQFCTNHGRCRDRFMQIEIVNATLTSLTLLITLGSVPFDSEISVKVKEGYRKHNDFIYGNRFLAKSKPHDEQSNNDYTILVEQLSGLNPDTWYTVTVCMHIRTPDDFPSRYPDLLLNLPPEHKFCLNEESRTLWSRRKLNNSSHLTSFSHGIIILAAFFFTIRFFCR